MLEIIIQSKIIAIFSIQCMHLFVIIQKFQRFKHHLSDEEVADWLQIDSEDAAQYANGISDFFLLSRHNAVLVGERLAEVHNARSFA